MKEKNRNQLILEYANEYSRIALKKGGKVAMQKFHKDYFTEKIFSVIEHEVILHLTKAYLLCKAGHISRTECNQEQKKLLSILED